MGTRVLTGRSELAPGVADGDRRRVEGTNIFQGRRRGLTACVLLLASLAAATPVTADQAAASPATDGLLSDGLLSDGPLRFTGAIDGELTGGGVHATGSPLIGATAIEAEHLEVEIAWEEGFRTGQDPTLLRRVTEVGHDSQTFDDVTVHLSEGRATATGQGEDLSQSIPELLALPEDPGSNTASPQTLELTGAADLAAWQKRSGTVVEVGPGEKAQGSPGAQPARYVHQIEEPVVWLASSAGDIRFGGELEVFVNNVTIHAVDGEGRTWSDWTGYRESDPDQEISEYEQRVVVLHLTGARLAIGQGPTLELFGPQAAVELDGLVASDTVSGQLPTGMAGEHRVYDDARLMLEGLLEVPLALPEDGTATRQAGHGPAGLAFQIEGQPSALGTDGGQVVQGQVPAAGGPGQGWLEALAVGGAVVIIGLASVAALRHGWLGVDDPLVRWREHRHKAYMAQGKRAADQEDWTAAAQAYGQAVKADREAAVAWFLWGLALVEDGQFEACLGILPGAANAPGMDPWDLLYLRATAAWGAGEDAMAASTLERMIDQDPAMTQRIVDRLGIDLDGLAPGLGDRLDRALAWRIGPPDLPGGGLDGYV